MEKENIKKHLPLIALVGVLVITLGVSFTQFNKKDIDFISSSRSSTKCNIGVIAIYGALATNSENNNIDSLSIAQTIRSLGVDGNEAILLLVDTPGGTAPAAEEISRSLDDINLPTAALIRGNALSGGYWVAASTDYIVALSSALVGNIGVTSSYLDRIGLNTEEGRIFQEITSGEYKEVGNSNKVLTAEHRRYLQGRTDDLFKIFANAVMANRDLSAEDFEKVSDGKFYIAETARDLSLIDEVGGIAEVKKYLAGRIGKTPDDLLFCEPAKFIK